MDIGCAPLQLICTNLCLFSNPSHSKGMIQDRLHIIWQLQLQATVLQVDGVIPEPVPLVPVVPVPPCHIRAVIRIRVVDENSSLYLNILILQVIDHIEAIIEETLVVEVEIVLECLCEDVLVHRPAIDVCLGVEEPGFVVVEEPGEGGLGVSGGLYQ